MPHVERAQGQIGRGDPDRLGAAGRKPAGMTGIMTVEPFEISPQRLPWLDAEIAERVATIIRDAERRLAGMTVAQDGRRGFGTVYAKGRMRTEGGTLTWWVWRYPNAEHCPPWLDAKRFADDPMGAVATDSLATRVASATAFAEAANAFFDPEDVQFFARSLEVVAAGPERTAGIYPGDEHGDVLAVDLMAGMSNPKIIDRLVWEEHKGDLREVQRHWDCTWLRVNVWHRAERLNAVRAMLDPSLPSIKVPGIAALRRRIEAAEEELEREMLEEAVR